MRSFHSLTASRDMKVWEYKTQTLLGSCRTFFSIYLRQDHFYHKWLALLKHYRGKWLSICVRSLPATLALRFFLTFQWAQAYTITFLNQKASQETFLFFWELSLSGSEIVLRTFFYISARTLVFWKVEQKQNTEWRLYKSNVRLVFTWRSPSAARKANIHPRVQEQRGFKCVKGPHTVMWRRVKYREDPRQYRFLIHYFLPSY